MRQPCPSIVQWSLITGSSTLLLKFCSTSLFFSSTRWMSSNYGDSLRSWATNGEQPSTRSRSILARRTPTDLQLIGAQIYFRHGARTPLHLLNGLEEVSYSVEHIENFAPTKWDVKLITKLGNEVVEKDRVLSANDILGDRIRKLKSVSGQSIVTGQLTAVGEKQLYQLGQRIRGDLISQEGLLPSIYDPQLVYCRSTYMNRTIASARSFLAGLFTSEQNDTQLQAKVPFEIEVHHFPDEDMFPNGNVFPALKTCPNASSLYTSLEDEHQMKKARQTLIDRLDLKDYLHGIIELHDDIVSRQAHGFAVPPELMELTKDFEVMSAREFVAMATTIDFDLFIRSTCGTLLTLMKKNFQSIVDHYQQTPNEPYQKLFVYSGHDTTLIPLAMALEIFDMRWPKYASSLLMKLYVSKCDSTQTFVTVDYAGEPQVLPNCDDSFCPMSTLMKNLSNRLAVSHPV